MEEKRRVTDSNWEEIKQFMKDQRYANEESNSYRQSDKLTQQFQAESIERLANQVTIQNGRVTKAEEWIKEKETLIIQKQKFNSNFQAWVTVIATLAMAIFTVMGWFQHKG